MQLLDSVQGKVLFCLPFLRLFLVSNDFRELYPRYSLILRSSSKSTIFGPLSINPIGQLRTSVAPMSIFSLFELQGKVALVTGGSRGIGGAAAEVLAEAGANILLLGRQMETLQQQAEGLARFGVATHSIRCDVGNTDDVYHAASEALAAFGQVDILINNAGIIRRAPAADYSLEDWQAVLDTNLTGAFLLTQQIGKTMMKRGSGKIINIASLLSFSGGMNVVAYTASKSALAGITRSFANEWGKYGVNVNAIAPGYIRTEATAALQNDPQRYQALLSRIPAARWGEPADLKGPILFLASNASNYVNGHILTVDGGWMAA